MNFSYCYAEIINYVVGCCAELKFIYLSRQEETLKSRILKKYNILADRYFLFVI